MAKYIYKHRRGTISQWADQNTIIPMEGEIVIEIDDVNFLHKLKIGDGIHTYAELAYLMAGDEIVTQVLAEAKPRIVTVTLAETWNQDDEGKYSQVVVLDNITEQSRLDLQPDANMLAEFKQLGLVFVTENHGGTITVYSVGNMPLKAYTMQATIVETECSGQEAVLGIPVGTPVAQSDWAQTDDTKADYIKNKPELGTIASKSEITKDDLSAELQESLDNAGGGGVSDITSKVSVTEYGSGVSVVKAVDNGNTITIIYEGSGSEVGIYLDGRTELFVGGYIYGLDSGEQLGTTYSLSSPVGTSIGSLYCYQSSSFGDGKIGIVIHYV